MNVFNIWIKFAKISLKFSYIFIKENGAFLIISELICCALVDVMLAFGVCECKQFQNTIGRHFFRSRETSKKFSNLF
jgi:hypothetical protein